MTGTTNRRTSFARVRYSTPPYTAKAKQSHQTHAHVYTPSHGKFGASCKHDNRQNEPQCPVRQNDGLHVVSGGALVGLVLCIGIPPCALQALARFFPVAVRDPLAQACGVRVLIAIENLYADTVRIFRGRGVLTGHIPLYGGGGSENFAWFR